MAQPHDLRALGTAQYVRLTTYRRDGTAVPTPVWVAVDGDQLLVITQRSSGKVKRLAHTPRVELAVCDMRGRVAPGTPAVQAPAAVLDDRVEVTRLTALLKDKYRLAYRLFALTNRLRPERIAGSVVIRIDASAAQRNGGSAA